MVLLVVCHQRNMPCGQRSRWRYVGVANTFLVYCRPVIGKKGLGLKKLHFLTAGQSVLSFSISAIGAIQSEIMVVMDA